jgi:hypothetical protein
MAGTPNPWTELGDQDNCRKCRSRHRVGVRVLTLPMSIFRVAWPVVLIGLDPDGLRLPKTQPHGTVTKCTNGFNGSMTLEDPLSSWRND